ncbi:F5/8 type C domain-containing protein [Paenibacillus sophorae]|uniref:F5/8 type C domain-containing protein n=1 Tax=Paenibacillus sophorae TaxID=1333845 RepID=A0A1H8H7P3_9BACL|nr:discoidin domain-containing protein [Paenibacillus sophorae]QWU14467.1 hypothetical protein KP014_21400 [Paenibacillus sophorae]SEN52049.1 F5/8 type C domain-containing protein [Paenibacillus sophorae]
MGSFGVNLIPQMTSMTAPGGVVTASTQSNTNTAWNAFNRDTADIGWNTASGTLIGWLAYEFSTATVIDAYVNYGYTDNRSPKNWTFEGSQDGTTWVVLDTRTNVTSYATPQEFTFTNTVAYKRYRINVTANNGSTTFLGIKELTMHKQYLNKILLSSENNVKSINTEKNMVVNTGSSVAFNNKVVTARNLAQTVMFKVKVDNLPSGTMDIISHINSGNVSKFKASISTIGTVVIYSAYTSSLASINLQTNSPLLNICDGKWHDIAYTWDGTTNSGAAKLYVDNMTTPYTTQTVSNIQTTETTGYLTVGNGTFGSFNIKDFASITRVATTQELSDFKAGSLSLSTANMNAYFKFQDSKNGTVDNLVTGTTISGVANNVDFVFPKIIDLKSSSEHNFLSYGLDNSLLVPDEIEGITDINDASVNLGTGKTFSHTIDLSKRKINKILFQ